MTVWLDPADDVQRNILREINALPQNTRNAYVQDLIMRGYRSDSDWIYNTMLRALNDYQHNISNNMSAPVRHGSSKIESPSNQKQSQQYITKQYRQEVDNIPENMLDFLISLQNEGEND